MNGPLGEYALLYVHTHTTSLCVGVRQAESEKKQVAKTSAAVH